MAHNIVCLGKYSVSTWKECIFCCFSLYILSIIERGLLKSATMDMTTAPLSYIYFYFVYFEAPWWAVQTYYIPSFKDAAPLFCFFLLALFPKRNLLYCCLCSCVHNVPILFSVLAAFKIFFFLYHWMWAIWLWFVILFSMFLVLVVYWVSWISDITAFTIFRRFKPLFLHVCFLSPPLSSYLHRLQLYVNQAAGTCPVSHCWVCFLILIFFSVLHFGNFLLLCLYIHLSFFLPCLICLNSIQCIYLLHSVAFISRSQMWAF